MDQAVILGLKRDQLTEHWIRFARAKTGQTVLIEWSAALREIIARARAINPVTSIYVFPKPNGGAYTSDGFRSIWHRAKVKAGVPDVMFRDLRRTAATESATPEDVSTARARVADDEGQGLPSRRQSETDEMTKGPSIVQPLRLAGRCASGAERGFGHLYHVVPFTDGGPDLRALCGAKPGRLSAGWHERIGARVTCQTCPENSVS